MVIRATVDLLLLERPQDTASDALHLHPRNPFATRANRPTCTAAKPGHQAGEDAHSRPIILPSWGSQQTPQRPVGSFEKAAGGLVPTATPSIAYGEEGGLVKN